MIGEPDWSFVISDAQMALYIRNGYHDPFYLQ